MYVLCGFPRAAMTNGHKPGDLKCIPTVLEARNLT